MNNNEIFFLDDNNNFTEKDKATKAISREVDEQGNLLKETFFSMGDNKSKPDYIPLNLTEADIKFIEKLGLDTSNLKIKS